MKKDIERPVVEGVTVVIAKKVNELNKTEWNVHLINENESDITNTLVTSKGYGQVDGETKKTSVLRHFLETVEAGKTALIEPIDPNIFHITNEYWVSYYMDGKLYDKRFVFLPESITNENLSYIKALDTEGILHS